MESLGSGAERECDSPLGSRPLARPPAPGHVLCCCRCRLSMWSADNEWLLLSIATNGQAILPDLQLRTYSAVYTCSSPMDRCSEVLHEVLPGNSLGQTQPINTDTRRPMFCTS